MIKAKAEAKNVWPRSPYHRVTQSGKISICQILIRPKTKLTQLINQIGDNFLNYFNYSKLYMSKT